MKRSIYIDGRHWDNIMALPCVRGLIKRSDYEILVKVKDRDEALAWLGIYR